MEHHPAFYCRYFKGLDRLQSKGNAWRDVVVIVLWGLPGVGKTRRAMEGEDVYKIDPPYKWWCGYSGEKTLLIDDYRDGDIDRGLILNLLDGYRLRLDTKGSHTWALWDSVYITSNQDPNDWRDKGIQRRITSIEHM